MRVMHYAHYSVLENRLILNIALIGLDLVKFVWQNKITKLFLLKKLLKISRSVRITHAGSWMVCKQYIILNRVLSEKNAFLKPIVNQFSHMTHQIKA